MNHLPFTLAAYFFNAVSVFSSKFLLNKAIPDPLVYIFYISLISFLAILALPFTKAPTLEVFMIASFSTCAWTLGAYLMYKALKAGNVSRVIPVIGTLIPLFLLIFASGTNTISVNQGIAVLILIGGMIFLTITDWRNSFNKWELIFEILSALAFAVSYITLRQAYLKLDFFSVLVWSRLILLPLGLTILIIPVLRKRIISSARPKINFFSKVGLIFLGGQLAGAISELLLLFSISLANPALVNSLQGTQYIFLLIFERKTYPLLVLFSKLSGIILIGTGLYLLAFS